jgi:O-antigen/teichoic acid export membrane protein
VIKYQRYLKETMQALIKRLTASSFLRHNAIFFVGSGLVSFLNYLYYPVLGRLLTPADFGEVQAIVSFFLQTGVFLQVLTLVTIGVVKRYPAGAQRAGLLAELERLALWVSLILLIPALAFSPWMQSFLHFHSPWPFILLALSVPLAIPAAFRNAFIQSQQRFGLLSGAGLIGAGSKLILSTGFVLVGLRSVGAIMGIVLAQVLSLLYAIFWARRLGGPGMSWRPGRPNLKLIRPELRYAGLVLITALAINVLLSVDIIVVKHYFSPHEAGLYAGIATIARIIYFLTGPLAGVLIATVVLGQTVHNRALVRRSLALVTFLGGSALIAFTLWPGFIISLLLGDTYTEQMSLLPPLSLAIFLLSIVNLLVYYHVALRHTRIVFAALTGLVVTMGLILVQHDTLEAVVTSLIQGSFLLLALVLMVGRWPGAEPETKMEGAS